MKNILTLLIIFISSASFGQDNGELLYNLVVKNDTEQSIKLISENANVNYVKESGMVKVNALITAINNKNIEIVRSLLKHKADVNWKDGFQTTALMYAAASGSKEMVELLLNSGADIKAKDGMGNTVLSAAKESGNEEVVKLIKQGMKK